ncbi:GSCFA domain-containing protein [Janthinobacterium sp. 17J80-10]|uniref:GSCFA domain-containing protein n=1 Tax=Janthinobacterium sp. 17J80-10 TaxID=2497863 RepID=UPI0010053121|nr:GSCFA domain-containing protein [Janthinobacterium sp. 17J80-10]QAU35549.1 hypothetical protein EKL02_16020 [Janthinobacterium sp. 17J80-10]
MTISRDAVTWGFRFILGREPGDEAAIHAHMQLDDINQLVEVLLMSEEFSISKRFSHLFSLKKPAQRALVERKQAELKVLILGNCQGKGLARLLQAMSTNVTATHLELTGGMLAQIRSGEVDIAKMGAENDVILLHPHAEFLQFIEQKHPDIRARIKMIPAINFSAFHPDLVYIKNGRSGHALGPLGEYQSSIAFYGWRNGLTVEETIGLFAEDVYAKLGFFDYWDSARAFLQHNEQLTGIPLEKSLNKWSAGGCWMYSVNHPKLRVLADVARAILAREGIDALPDAEQFVQDDLASGPVWPVYPEIGKRLGIGNGHYFFKKIESECGSDRPVQMIDLPQFVKLSFDAFSAYRKADLVCERLDSAPYQELAAYLASRRQSGFAPQAAAAPALAGASQGKSNPYLGLTNHQFWRRGVERVTMKDVDPVVRAGFSLAPAHKVATAGSCFAQHISRTLQKNGFNYYVAEDGDGLATDETLRRNFGVFSARFGNLYTARQLLQLFDRAYGAFTPQEGHWVREDGRLVDPFRPQIEPDGFATLEDLEQSRQAHFAAVRRMFETLDVFVFTLGLTEAWRSKQDGAVYPLAPGVAGGAFDTRLHEFVNFGVADVVADMNAFIGRLQRVNPAARMIVTVSPVPLIATYENRHVLVATSYSKAVLRAAAEEVCNANATMCEYFPSYEIITGNYTRGEYFDNDLRSVKQEGVDHVMRLFLLHYSTGQQISTHNESLMRENAQVNAIVCDEEAIDRGASAS